jgi:predicted N-acetyltransferase YhbS
MSAVTLGRLEASAHAPDWAALGTLLQDAVAAGASLGFWSPMDELAAAAYWEDIREAIPRAHTVVLVARFEGEIVGSVVVTDCPQENARHRADISKLMVHTEYRRHGLGRRLIQAAEQEGRARGKTLLVLDTRTGDPAEILYVREGWRCAGVIPNYTVERDGASHDTSVFYKHLA